jgi:DNA adenine methylase
MPARQWGTLETAPLLQARPFLKWAGGKGQVIPLLRQELPSLGEGQRYFEPFLGGGAVFFALQPKLATLSDLNRTLITAFLAVKNRPQELLLALARLPAPTSSEEYYGRRTEFNRLLATKRGLTGPETVEVAALLIWLNHTCFNGLFRVNRAGLFNVPYGAYRNPSIYSKANIRAASRSLRTAHAILKAEDFEKVLRPAEKGDFVYLDPPYQPLTATARFTSYTSGGFGEEDQERLARVVHDLISRGCRVVLSNSATPRIRDLYRDLPQRVVMVPRAINCVGTRRAPVEELVVASPGPKSAGA